MKSTATASFIVARDRLGNLHITIDDHPVTPASTHKTNDRAIVSQGFIDAGFRDSARHACPILRKPVGMFLLGRNATATYCHSKTVDLPSTLRSPPHSTD